MNQKHRRVILESPFAGDVAANSAYARRCMRDSLLRGEAPMVSHLLYTQEGVLNDDIETERQHGIDAGLAWGEVAEATVCYLDRGISRGMQYGLINALHARRPVEARWFDCPVRLAMAKLVRVSESLEFPLTYTFIQDGWYLCDSRETKVAYIDAPSHHLARTLAALVCHTPRLFHLWAERQGI